MIEKRLNSFARNIKIKQPIVCYKMRKKMLVKEIEMKITKLEAQIAENIGDLESMRRELNRLKLQAFEEDLRESGEKQLLQG